MDVKEAIAFCEAKLEDDLMELSEKDRIMVYLNMKEFELPKKQREPYIDEESENKNITVTYVNASDKSTQKSNNKSKKN